MADSRRSPPADGAGRHDVRGAVLDLLGRTLPQGGRVAVALSGGRDSIALLDAVASVAAVARVDAAAFHVHHGLSPNADRWAAFCRDACAARSIDFALREVALVPRARTSVEAAARAARYDALAALAHEYRAAAVLLAHHADDQAETVLLQLLRGAGPRGLAAMPETAADRGVCWLRPFLALPRHVLETYVATHALGYVDDESNRDARYRRNALRASVVPALRALAADYPSALVRAARRHAEAAALLDALAEIDAGPAVRDATLECAALRTLDAPRARNLLRWFLRQSGLRAPSSARLAAMLEQLATARHDARVTIAHDGAELGVHRGRLIIHRPGPGAFAHAWTGEASIGLPHGTLVFTATQGSGIAQRCLAASAVIIRDGRPGERLRITERGARRAVADLLREAGVPAWERAGLPRLYCGEILAAVPHAGVDAAFAARGDEPAFTLDWQPR